MSQSIREIYQDYQYELIKLQSHLDDLSPSDTRTVLERNAWLLRAERVESLVDLYAYVLANQRDDKSS